MAGYMAGGRAISGRDLARMYELAGQHHASQDEARRKVTASLMESVRRGELAPKDFSIRELFAAIMPRGREIVESWQNPKSGYGTELLESGGGAGAAVAYGDFSNITGQIFFTEVLEQYSYHEFVFSSLIEKKQSTIQDIEKLPRIGRIGDVTTPISEGAAYPRFGVGEDYIEVAGKQKRGGIVEVTREAVAGDKTGQLLQSCGELGYWLGYSLEERVIDALIDEGSNAASAHLGGHRYTWRGTAYASYQASTPWINVKASNAFTDETTVDALWQVLRQITDPLTGKPIMMAPDTLIVTDDILWRATRVMAASEVRQTAPGYATSGSPAQTVSSPALSKIIPGLKIVSSPILKARLTTDTDWFLGTPRKAVRQYYNWDIVPAQRGTGTDAEFERDVVMQWKASIKDVVSVIEPRAMGKSTVA